MKLRKWFDREPYAANDCEDFVVWLEELQYEHGPFETFDRRFYKRWARKLRAAMRARYVKGS
jgi:hypothetical protein